MHKYSSTILYAACIFRPYKSTPVLKLFRTFTGKMTRGLSLQMTFSPLFVKTLFILLSRGRLFALLFFTMIFRVVAGIILCCCFLTLSSLCMYVWGHTHKARVWINRVRLPILHVVVS